MTKRKIMDWVVSILIAVVLSITIRTYIAEARWIPSGSMEPTLDIGDRIIIDKIFFKQIGLHRQDIIVFDAPFPVEEKKALIKRIIGLPGDVVQVKNGQVIVNGQALIEPYELEKPAADYGPVTVPEDMLFVMGDNRNNSADSRIWGYLPEKNIIGRAFVKYYPINHMSLID
ncbi:MAG: signal peptidase I [Bacillota bacterium]